MGTIHSSNYFYAVLPSYFRTDSLGVMHSALCHIYNTYHACCHRCCHHHCGCVRREGGGCLKAGPDIRSPMKVIHLLWSCGLVVLWSCGLSKCSDCCMITACLGRREVTYMWLSVPIPSLLLHHHC